MSVELSVDDLVCQDEEAGIPQTLLGIDLLQQCAAMEVPGYFSHKGLPMRLLAALMLIPAAPVIGLLVLLVRGTSAGPGIYAQKRVGRMGREFMMYKIRTMYQDAEAGSGPVWCKENDARITCVGRVLRFLHLDELPQLWNIVLGEMDLIGPRPERLKIVERLVNEIPSYVERLAVLPGVTGLAQINLPPDETTNCVRRKLILDQEYIQTATWRLDLRILACTALRMVGIRHGLAAHWLRLARTVSESEVTALKFESDEVYLTDPGLSEPIKVLAPVLAVGKPHQPGYGGNGQHQPNAEPFLPPATFVREDATEDSHITAPPRNPR